MIVRWRVAEGPREVFSILLRGCLSTAICGILEAMRLFLTCCFALFPLLSLRGQIFADFTISSGIPPTTTPLGTFRVRLEHDKAPRPVANFIGLATGRRPWIDIDTGAIKTTPYYDGTIFHRLDHDFVIQGGDIKGTGQGGPGFVSQDQFHPDLRHSGRYILSMAKTSLPNTTGSQFFITLVATPFLDDKHSVFGEVITNRNLVDNFADPALFPTTGESPTTQINLDSVVISGPDFASFDLHDPALRLPLVEAVQPEPSYDAGAGIFTLSFPRDPQSFYTIATSNTLTSLSPLGYLASLDRDTGYSLNVTGLSGARYFSRLTKVDYSLVVNAPSDLVAAGHTVELLDGSGGSLSLNFTSPTEGTWTHTDGSHGDSPGDFTVTRANDRVGSVGAGTTRLTFPTNFPLYDLAVSFDSPAGPEGWASFDVVMSFHEPLAGWVDGSVTRSTSSDPSALKQAFIYTP